jgi:hypothetical protein
MFPQRSLADDHFVQRQPINSIYRSFSLTVSQNPLYKLHSHTVTRHHPWPNELHSHSHGRWRAALRSSPLRSGVLFGAVIFANLIFYTTFLSPQDSLWHRPQDWHGLLQGESLILDPENTPPSTTPPTPATVEIPPSPSPTPDVLTVEQIRDLVAPTTGFFARDYSLGRGWNNVSMHGA